MEGIVFSAKESHQDYGTAVRMKKEMLDMLTN